MNLANHGLGLELNVWTITAGVVWAYLFCKAFWDMRRLPRPPKDWNTTIGILERQNWEGALKPSVIRAHSYWSNHWLRQKRAAEDLKITVRANEDCS